MQDLEEFKETQGGGEAEESKEPAGEDPLAGVRIIEEIMQD